MSDTNATPPGVSPLDRAHAARLEKQPEVALRLASSILAATVEDASAAWLVGRLLVEAGRPEAAGKAAVELVARFIRRGDLASSILAVQLAGEAGKPVEPLARKIAEAFGKGSPQLAATGSIAPPPLPVESEVAPYFAKLSGDALLDAAEKTLAKALGTRDRSAPQTPSRLPQLPLFGELSPPVLEQLLMTFQLHEFAPGAYVVQQGAEGSEAYLLARGVLNVVREDAEGASVIAVLGPGALFGEMALVSNAPRAASVVAVEPALVFAAPRADLETLAQREPSIGKALGDFCRHRMIGNLVRHSRILSRVEPIRRPELIGRFKSQTFSKGQSLVRQGEEAERLFLIASGGVEVRRKDADGDRVVLAALGPGDVVGEISIVLRRPATADVVAVHTTVALELTRAQFQEAIREYPGLLQELYELATRRDDETRSVVAQPALDVSDSVLL